MQTHKNTNTDHKTRVCTCYFFLDKDNKLDNKLYLTLHKVKDFMDSKITNHPKFKGLPSPLLNDPQKDEILYDYDTKKMRMVCDKNHSLSRTDTHTRDVSDENCKLCSTTIIKNKPESNINTYFYFCNKCNGVYCNDCITALSLVNYLNDIEKFRQDIFDGNIHYLSDHNIDTFLDEIHKYRRNSSIISKVKYSINLCFILNM